MSVSSELLVFVEQGYQSDPVTNLPRQGYLRAAKALLLARKPEKALDVYEYALKTLDKHHAQREVSSGIIYCLNKVF